MLEFWIRAFHECVKKVCLFFVRELNMVGIMGLPLCLEGGSINKASPLQRQLHGRDNMRGFALCLEGGSITNAALLQRQ